MNATEKPPETTWIGRYEVVGHLADGGMAEIVLGRILGPSGFQRPVVIKRILPHLARQQDFVEMFLDEARIVAGIRHPNVVQVHELGNEDGALFLVMEYLEGESLSGLTRRLRSQGEALDRGLAAYIIAEACGGLHAAHELLDPSGNKQNVVHRDVSPQNIFVTYDGQVKVLDFGIAVAADRVTRTEAGTFKGKFEYASPEQCKGHKLDRRSDVWALGVVLYEISTGTRLFKRPGQLDTMRAICDQQVPPPATDVPGYPEALSNVVKRALERRRDERYATALDMRRDLIAAIRSMGDALSPAEDLSLLMRRLFSDRVTEKVEMLRRVQSGSAVTQIPAVETDVSVEIPVAHSVLPSAPPTGSAPVVIPAPPRVADVSVNPSTLVGTVDEAPARKSSRALVVGAAAVLALGVAGVALAIASRTKTPATVTESVTSAAPLESAPPVPSQASTAAPAPTATEVVVRVETEPPKAHVLVGGEDRGLSPVELKLVRDTSAVVIEIRRDGYRPLRESIVPEVDQRLRLTLVATAAPGQPAAAAAAPKPAPIPAPTPSAKGAKYQRFE